MKIIEGMQVTEMGDGYVAVPTGPAAQVLHGIVRLNGTGLDVWKGLEEGLDEDGIVARLMERYEVDDERARASVQSVINDLSDAGLLV